VIGGVVYPVDVRTAVVLLSVIVVIGVGVWVSLREGR